MGHSLTSWVLPNRHWAWRVAQWHQTALFTSEIVFLCLPLPSSICLRSSKQCSRFPYFSTEEGFSATDLWKQLLSKTFFFLCIYYLERKMSYLGKEILMWGEKLGGVVSHCVADPWFLDAPLTPSVFHWMQLRRISLTMFNRRSSSVDEESDGLSGNPSHLELPVIGLAVSLDNFTNLLPSSRLSKAPYIPDRNSHVLLLGNQSKVLCAHISCPTGFSPICLFILPLLCSLLLVSIPYQEQWKWISL